MSIDTGVVFAMSNIRCGWGDKFIRESSNGLIHGLCIIRPFPGEARICKFTIDVMDE